jgi:hypothetical protein
MEGLVWCVLGFVAFPATVAALVFGFDTATAGLFRAWTVLRIAVCRLLFRQVTEAEILERLASVRQVVMDHLAWAGTRPGRVPRQVSVRLYWHGCTALAGPKGQLEVAWLDEVGSYHTMSTLPQGLRDHLVSKLRELAPHRGHLARLSAKAVRLDGPIAVTTGGLMHRRRRSAHPPTAHEQLAHSLSRRRSADLAARLGLA